MKRFRAGDWDLELFQATMTGHSQLDSLAGEHCVKLPGMLFYESFARMTQQAAGLVYEISPLEGLKLCKEEDRKDRLFTGEALNSENITMVPGDLKVAMAAH